MAFPFWRYEKSANIYYEKIEGPDNETAILFIHGLGGTHTYWSKQYQELRTRASLYFIDLLGFGYSAKPRGDYTLEKHAAALREFIVQNVKEKNIIFVAHSLGALVALAYVAGHPEKIRTAYLLGLPYFHSAEEAHESLQKSGSLLHFFLIDTFVAKILCRLMCTFRPLPMLLVPLFKRNMPKPLVRDAFLHTYDSYFSTLQHLLFEQNIPALLTDAVRKKIFLIHGESDTTAPAKNIQELAATYSLHLLLLPAEEHDFPLTSPNKVISLLTNML